MPDLVKVLKNTRHEMSYASKVLSLEKRISTSPSVLYSLIEGVSITTFCCILNLIGGIFLIKYSLYDFFMEDRLQMRPGMPAYEFWKEPEPEVIVKIRVFNITNGDAFLNGTDSTIKLDEVGPIVYREILKHSDVIFNNNSTLSYTATKILVFKDERNRPGILNETIVVPNMATLGIASYLSNAGFLVNLGAKALMSNADEEPLRKITIYDYLWNYKSDVLSMAKTVGGSILVPVENMGVLYNIYKNYSDKLNVKIGPKYESGEFFQLLSYNYGTTVPGFKLDHGHCNASILGATEGAIYPQFLDKNSTLYYWRKTLCRPARLYFEEEVQKGPLLGYKFVLKNNVYDHSNDETTIDCYKGNPDTLPDGLSDLSKCFHNFPVAASKPHFYGRSGDWVEKLQGLHPNRTLHDSYIIVEPTMGTPIDQCARSQSNLVIKTIHRVYPEKMKRFSNSIIPMFWIEIHQPDLTPLIIGVIHFTINILPTLEKFLGPLMIIFSISVLVLVMKRIIRKKEISEKEKFELL
uniref:CSON001578 protein n=1 Tax=Culicoides sonorensis TaxID=179676 RepID=A0A336MGZ2_CULSO